MTNRCAICGAFTPVPCGIEDCPSWEKSLLIAGFLLGTIIFATPAVADPLSFAKNGTSYTAVDGDTHYEIRPATSNPNFRWLLMITNEKTGQSQPLDAVNADEALLIVAKLRQRNGGALPLPQ